MSSPPESGPSGSRNPRTSQPMAAPLFSTMLPLQPQALWNLLSHSWDQHRPTNEGQEGEHPSSQESRKNKKSPQPQCPSAPKALTGVKGLMSSTGHVGGTGSMQLQAT